MKVSLNDVMGWSGPVTARQLSAWEEWFEQEWNKPTRTDQYLMQIATEIRRSYVKHPRSVKLDHMRLKFELRKARQHRKSLEQATADAVRWVAALGGGAIPDNLPDELRAALPSSQKNRNGHE